MRNCVRCLCRPYPHMRQLPIPLSRVVRAFVGPCFEQAFLPQANSYLFAEVCLS